VEHAADTRRRSGDRQPCASRREAPTHAQQAAQAAGIDGRDLAQVEGHVEGVAGDETGPHRMIRTGAHEQAPVGTHRPWAVVVTSSANVQRPCDVTVVILIGSLSPPGRPTSRRAKSARSSMATSLVKTSSPVSEELAAHQSQLTRQAALDLGRPWAHVSTTFRLCTTVSISSCVVVRPKLNLTAPMPLCGGTCIACRTGDSSMAPEWQAEPVDAATSFSACRISAPILPGKQTFSVFGSRSVGCPLRATL
jgi:hypothetical protein